MAKTNKEVQPKKRRAPSPTPEGRENQLISLAVDLAEKQLLDGTASTQVITHFLKLGTTKNELEKEKLKRENLLLEAKTKNIQSQEKMEEMYQDVIDALRSYNGLDDEPTD